MLRRQIKIEIVLFFVATLVCVGGFLVSVSADIQNSSQDINIHAQVGGGCSATCGNHIVECSEVCDLGSGVNGACGQTCSSACTRVTDPPACPPDHTLAITNLQSLANYTTATISWNVSTDISGVVSCGPVNYGLDSTYGQTIAAVSSSLGWATNFSGLTTGTLYYYNFTCSVGGSSISTSSSFTTAGAPVVITTVDLTVLAKPGMRITKTGGNYSFGGSVLFYNPITGKTTSTVNNLVFNNAGMATASSVRLPVGSGWQAYLKGAGYLSKKITGINIVSGQNLTLDFTDNDTYRLTGGDLAGNIGDGVNSDLVSFLRQFSRDDFIDILDVSKADVLFNSDAGNYANLNGDQIVDMQDTSIILINWNRFGSMINI